MRRHRSRPSLEVAPSAFAGFRFPPEVIVLAVRWYLRFGLSYRDLEELPAERGIEVDHVTLYRWVQPRPARHTIGLRLARQAAGIAPAAALDTRPARISELELGKTRNDELEAVPRLAIDAEQHARRPHAATSALRK